MSQSFLIHHGEPNRELRYEILNYGFNWIVTFFAACWRDTLGSGYLTTPMHSQHELSPHVGLGVVQLWKEGLDNGQCEDTFKPLRFLLDKEEIERKIHEYTCKSESE